MTARHPAMAPARLLTALLPILLAALLAGCGTTAALEAPTTSTSPTTSNLADAVRTPAGCPAPSTSAPGAAESRLPVRSLCALPPEAATVWRTISTGGRLAYPKDGSTFGNFERRLPQRARGYYREYTVPTPGSPDRGARRFVSGSSRELYYTGDHYRSFVVVDPTATG